MKKSIIFASIVSISLLLSSCGSTDVMSALFDSSETAELMGVIGDNAQTEEEKALFTGLKKNIEDNQDITPENEYYIGRSVAANILEKYPLYTKSTKFITYLNNICAAITVNSDKPYLYNGYRVAIMDTDEINAMATPGGHIFISRGLIECTDSEDALAAVIAHEVAHIQLEHCMLAIKSSRGAEAFKKDFSQYISSKNEKNPDSDFTPEEITAFVAVVSGGCDMLIEKGFPSAQEFDADKKALQLMSDAGYDPSAMIDMLSMIEKKSDAKSGWGTTHPKPKTRIKLVETNLKKTSYTFSDRSNRQERFEKNISYIK